MEKYCLIKQHGYLTVFFGGKAKEKIGVLIGDILYPVTKCRPQGEYEREIQDAKDL